MLIRLGIRVRAGRQWGANIHTAAAVGTCCVWLPSFGGILASLSKHKDLPFPLSCCFCPVLWFLFQILATDHWPLPYSPAPAIRAVGHVCSPVPDSSTMTSLPSADSSVVSPRPPPQAFQPGTSMSASVGPHPKKTRITSQWALSLWPELWPILQRTHSLFHLQGGGSHSLSGSHTIRGSLQACSCVFLPWGLCAHTPGVYCGSPRHFIRLVQVMPSESQVSGSMAETPQPAHSQPRK